MQSHYDAVVIAGYDPARPDPVAAQHGVARKVLIPMLGRPMVWHLVQALAACPRVERIVVAGMGPEDGVDFGCDVEYVPNQGRLFANAYAGVEHLAQAQDWDRHVLVASADIPAIPAQSVDWFLDACHPYDKDIYMAAVERQVLEATFPGSNRSYLRLVEGQFCNGTLVLVRIEPALRKQQVIQELIDRRKSVFQQIELLGWRTVLKFIFRRLRMQDLTGVARKLIDVDAAAVIAPYAQLGMDVDKPHQFDQVLAYMQQHPAGSS